MNERPNGSFNRTRFHNVEGLRHLFGLLPGREHGIRGAAYFENGENLLHQSEREKISEEINGTLCGLDRFIQAQSDGKEFIIDMYNAPPVKASPMPTSQAIRILRRDIERIDKLLERDKVPDYWAVKRDGFVALITFLEEKEKPPSKRLPDRELLKRISGFIPYEIPPSTLAADRRRFVSLLGATGLVPFDIDNQSVKEAYELYHYWQSITDTALIERELMSKFFTFRNQLSTALKTDLRDVTFKVRLVEDDAPNMAFERVLPEGNRLDVNVLPSKLHLWGREEISRYARHEGMHFFFGHFQAQEIREGRLDSIAGYVLIPSPECWISEGIAQTIDDFSGIEGELDERVSVALYRMYVRARNNALFYLKTGQMDMSQAIKFMEGYTPHKTTEEIEKELSDGTENIFWTAYLPNYGYSDFEMMHFLSGFNNDGKRSRLLQMLKMPMTHTQFVHNFAQPSF